MGWPRDPRIPFGNPRTPPGDLPPEFRALMERAQDQVRRAMQIEVRPEEHGPGGGRDHLEALAERSRDPELHALLTELRAGELSRREVMLHPAYLRAMREAVGSAREDVARLPDGGAALRARGSEQWAAFRADPDGFGSDDAEPEGGGGR